MDIKAKCPLCGIDNILTTFSEDVGEVERHYNCLHCGYNENMAYSEMQVGVDTVMADSGVWPSAKRLWELAQAEKDGRLVVLPCKVGDTVYTNLTMSGWYFRDNDRPYSAKVVFVGLNGSDDMGGGLFNVVYGKHDHMMQFQFSDIGKTVFLTREEAEAALAGKGGDE